MKKLIIAISSLWLMCFSNAFSLDLNPSFGISGNTAAYAATGIEKNFNEAGTAVDTTTEEYGAFQEDYASIFVEMGLTDAISLGIDYVPMVIETPTNTSRDGANANTVRAEIENLTTIYAKLNVPLGGTYIKLGYSHADITSIETMSSSNPYGNDTTQGPTVGLGYNHELDNGVSIRAEVTASSFDDVQANNGQTNKTEILIEDMIGARGTISLVKSF